MDFLLLFNTQQCYPSVVSSQPYLWLSQHLVCFSVCFILYIHLFTPQLFVWIAAVTTVVPPARKGVWNDPGNTLDLSGTNTDTNTIVSTAKIVDQKGGATGDPDQPVPSTAVTAVDGQLTPDGTSGGTTSRRRSTGISRRAPSDYELVFPGTGTGPNDRDGSIQGTAYLTFTVVNNSTYNVDACLAFCDSVQSCGSLLLI